MEQQCESLFIFNVCKWAAWVFWKTSPFEFYRRNNIIQSLDKAMCVSNGIIHYWALYITSPLKFAINISYCAIINKTVTNWCHFDLHPFSFSHSEAVVIKASFKNPWKISNLKMKLRGTVISPFLRLLKASDIFLMHQLRVLRWFTNGTFKKRRSLNQFKFNQIVFLLSLFECSNHPFFPNHSNSS